MCEFDWPFWKYRQDLFLCLSVNILLKDKSLCLRFDGCAIELICQKTLNTCLCFAYFVSSNINSEIMEQLLSDVRRQNIMCVSVCLCVDSLLSHREVYTCCQTECKLLLVSPGFENNACQLAILNLEMVHIVSSVDIISFNGRTFLYFTFNSTHFQIGLITIP